MDANSRHSFIAGQLYEARKNYASAQAQARIYAKQIEALKSDLKSIDFDPLSIFETT